MSALPQVMPLSVATEIMQEEGSLASLRPGTRGLVTALEEGSGDAVAKLLALGVVPGMQLALESVGPAVVFRIGHARFAVDRALAGAIRVQRVER
ncbi:MAG: FeoA family protein [Deltaproteobacteria bacterium]|nr:FeoA family protein [Deltaproteobacteria bacterium]